MTASKKTANDIDALLKAAVKVMKKRQRGMQALATSEVELKIYRTLMQGWPAGQDIVDQLNRARYEDYED